jgi:uncharacterized membrane protein YeaQ/YmgE (transglycosylase-associated protein family)
MNFLWFILIGLVAGWLGSLIVKGSGLGLLWNLIIGVVGGVLGGWIFSLLGIHTGGGIWGSLLTAVAGAVVLLLLVNLFTRKKA